MSGNVLWLKPPDNNNSFCLGFLPQINYNEFWNNENLRHTLRTVSAKFEPPILESLEI
jgi:hypothetical protein